MHISQGQLSAMHDAAFATFLRRLSADFQSLRDAAPSPFMPSDNAQFDIELRGLVATARRFGIETERGLAAFVAIAFSYSPKFYEHPGALDVLRAEHMSPDDRVLLLLSRVVHPVERNHVLANLDRRLKELGVSREALLQESVDGLEGKSASARVWQRVISLLGRSKS